MYVKTRLKALLKPFFLIQFALTLSLLIYAKKIKTQSSKISAFDVFCRYVKMYIFSVTSFMFIMFSVNSTSLFFFNYVKMCILSFLFSVFVIMVSVKFTFNLTYMHVKIYILFVLVMFAITFVNEIAFEEFLHYHLWLSRMLCCNRYFIKVICYSLQINSNNISLLCYLANVVIPIFSGLSYHIPCLTGCEYFRSLLIGDLFYCFICRFVLKHLDVFYILGALDFIFIYLFDLINLNTICKIHLKINGS